MSWIRQAPGKGLECNAFISTYNIPISYSVTLRFTKPRDDSSIKLYLQLGSLKIEDTAVYYFAGRAQWKRTVPKLY